MGKEEILFRLFLLFFPEKEETEEEEEKEETEEDFFLAHFTRFRFQRSCWDSNEGKKKGRKEGQR